MHGGAPHSLINDPSQAHCGTRRRGIHPSSTAPAGAATLPQQAGSGVYYEIFVRSFADSNGDGIGDLNGITARLDYLKWLGVSGLWLTPIYPSASYHGYDITDYFADQPAVRHDGGFSSAVAGGPCPRHQGADRHGAQPHQRPQSVVPAGARSQEPLPRLVHVGRQGNRPRRAEFAGQPGLAPVATGSTISAISAAICRISTTTARPCAGR